jgi:hypothetical protein
MLYTNIFKNATTMDALTKLSSKKSKNGISVGKTIKIKRKIPIPQLIL